MAATDAEADKFALADLSSRITVKVVGRFDIDNKEIIENGNQNSQNVTKSIIGTYTSSMLTNTECIYLSHEPKAHVFRYINRAEVHRIFTERERRAKEFIRMALECESKGRIDEALRCYYWALCLVRSLQHPSGASTRHSS